MFCFVARSSTNAFARSRKPLMLTTSLLRICTLALTFSCTNFALARQDEGRPPQEGPPPFGQDGAPPDPLMGPGGRGMGGGMGGGGPNAPERKMLAKFDVNSNGRLEGAELDAAREELKKNPPQSRGGGGGRQPGGESGPMGRGGPGGPGGPGGDRQPGTKGPAVALTDVKHYKDAPLFSNDVVRTVFLEFPMPDWEAELELFHGTDIDFPATMTVDGVKYEGVGVHFRGASSYMMVPRGSKRSFNISIDHTDPTLRLYGQSTLNLLNSNGDPSMLSSVLYSHLAAGHLAVPAANLVQVVVNGESWGVFASLEQFNKSFLIKHWPDFKGDGARWKVHGSPQATSGLDYGGDDVAYYTTRYEIKSKASDKDWNALIKLCRVLTETPLDELEAALTPIFDIDSALWFIAMDIASSNSDGYWVRSSDYSIYRDPKGVFHILPHDMNEAFKGHAEGPGGGRGMRGGRPGGRQGGPQGGPPDGPPDQPRPPQDQPPPNDQGGMRGPRGGAGGMSGFELDPLHGLTDARKPLRSRLLALPSLRARYLECVKTIARDMSWDQIGPFVAQQRTLIEGLVAADTRKGTTTASFLEATASELPAASTNGRESPSLRMFFERRSKYLLNYTPKDAEKPAEKPATAATPAAR